MLLGFFHFYYMGNRQVRTSNYTYNERECVWILSDIKKGLNCNIKTFNFEYINNKIGCTS